MHYWQGSEMSWGARFYLLIRMVTDPVFMYVFETENIYQNPKAIETNSQVFLE